MNSLISEQENLMVWVKDKQISYHLHWVKSVRVGNASGHSDGSGSGSNTMSKN